MAKSLKYSVKNILETKFGSLPRRATKSLGVACRGSGRPAQSVILTGSGGYDKLTYGNQNVPMPGKGQVLLAIKAGGMNFADLYERQGLFRPAGLPKPPYVMGREASGQVEEVGEGVHPLKVGDRVACLTNKTGLWTEFACVDASNCILIPQNMNYDDAAAFYTNYLTAYCAIFMFGNLKPGQKVFIHSLAGGVGWAATQLAKTVSDVTVLGTASLWKFDAIKSNGVDLPISAAQANYVALVKEKYPEGVDIILDNKSGNDFNLERTMLRQMGKIIHLGINNAMKGEQRSILHLIKVWWELKNVSIFDLIMSNQSVCGLNLDTLREKCPERFNDAVRELNKLYAEGLVKPRIDSTWSFKLAGKATEHLTSRKSIGKILLKPNV